MTEREFCRKLDEIRDTFVGFEVEPEDVKKFGFPFDLIQIFSILMDVIKIYESGEGIEYRNLIDFFYHELRNHYQYNTKEEFYDIFINIFLYILESKGCRCGYLSLNNLNDKLIELTKIYDMEHNEFNEKQNSHDYLREKYKNSYFEVLPNEIIKMILKLKEYGYDPDDLDYRYLLDIFYTNIENYNREIEEYKNSHNRYDECYKIISELFETENFPKTKEWLARNGY